MSEIVVLHGTPGSGKTTNAQRFKEIYPNEIEHISIGNRLRSIRQGEVESRFKKDVDEQAEILSQSKPLDHEIVNGIVFEFIEQCPSMGAVLIDGYPRFVEQLQLFFNSLELEKHLYLGVILLSISEETCVSRLTKRGARSVERDVDVDFAARRFNGYLTHTLPTIALLAINSELIKIDAEPPIEDVWGVFYKAATDLIFNREDS